MGAACAADAFKYAADFVERLCGRDAKRKGCGFLCAAVFDGDCIRKGAAYRSFQAVEKVFSTACASFQNP